MHNVTFDDGETSGDQGTGHYQRTFATAGSYAYHCTIHGAKLMSGTITVGSGSGGTAGGGGGGGGGGGRWRLRRLTAAQLRLGIEEPDDRSFVRVSEVGDAGLRMPPTSLSVGGVPAR